MKSPLASLASLAVALLLPVGVLHATSTLAVSDLEESATAGTDSVVLVVNPQPAAWTAVSSASWLHTSASGTGTADVAFSFDANPGATRIGYLTVAGQVLTVRQDGSPSIPPLPLVNTLVPNAAGVGIAVDAAGNVYFPTAGGIKKWTAATRTVGTVVLLGSSYYPTGLAIDGSGNLYFAVGTAIQKWTAATQTVTTLVPTGAFTSLGGLAVDTAGNVYFADVDNSIVSKWTAATQTVSTLVSTGLSYPEGIAVDSSGNVYINDTGHQAIKEWTAATQTLSTLISAGLSGPAALAVDSAGNVYVLDKSKSEIKEWTVATQTLSTLVSGYGSGVFGTIAGSLTVDAAGNLYFSAGSAVQKWTAATQTAGTLFITNIYTSGALAVDGAGDVYFMGGSGIAKWTPATQTANSVVSTSIPNPAGLAVDGTGNLYFGNGTAVEMWTAATQTLTTLVPAGSLSSIGALAVDAAGNVYVSDYQKNLVAKWTVSTQTLGTLISTGLNRPIGLAVDGIGNLYIANNGANSVLKWTASSQTLGTLISNGLSDPVGLAVDGAGNVYTTDVVSLGIYGGDTSIKMWAAATQTLSTVVLVNRGFFSTLGKENKYPAAVGVDAAGNVYYSAELESDNFMTKTINGFADELIGYLGAEIDEVTLSGTGGQATTLAATSISSGTSSGWATLNGSASLNGTATLAFFEYGTSTNYNAATPFVSLGSGSSTVPVSFNATPLARGTTYHYRLVTFSGSSVSFGSDLTFTTPSTASPPAWHSGQVSALTNPNLNNMADGARTGAADTDRQIYYYKGTDSNIWCVYLNGSAWTQAQLTSDGNVNDWLTFGGTPGALCYLGKDNQIWSVFWNGAKWAVAQLGSVPGEVTITGDLAIDNMWNTVYFRSTDALVHLLVFNGKTWGYGIEGAIGSSIPNVQSNLKVDPKYHQVYYQGTDNQLWCYHWTGTQYLQQQLSTDLTSSIWLSGGPVPGGLVGGALSVDALGLTVYYRSSVDNSAGCVYWNGKAWIQETLSSSANINASPASFSDATPYTSQYDTLYIDGNNQAEALWWTGKVWTHAVLGDGASGLTGGLSLQPTSHWIFARRNDGNIVIFWYQ